MVLLVGYITHRDYKSAGNWAIQGHLVEKATKESGVFSPLRFIKQTTAYQENLLCDTLDRMRRNPEGRKVVHLHLSKLLPGNRTPVKSKIVSRMFGNLESAMHVQIFPMINQDLVMTVNAGSQRDVNASYNRIRTLFDDEPHTYSEDANGDDHFVSWYDLEVDSAMAMAMARYFLNERGYQICVDGLTLDTFSYADPIRMGVTYGKLSWSNEIAGLIGTERGEELKAMIMMRKRGRKILARCDSEAVIRAGRQLGITLFQGRYVDGLMRERY